MPNAAEFAPMSSVHAFAEAQVAAGAHKRCFAAVRDLLLMTIVSGSHWRHYRSTNVYVVRNVVWDSNLDCWSVQYRRQNDQFGIDFTRALPDFFGCVTVDGECVPRFEQVP